MRIIGKRKMNSEHAKYAWRIAFVGFNSRGEAQYYLYNKKEALENNPRMEYYVGSSSEARIGVL